MTVSERLLSRQGLIAAWALLVLVQLPIREVTPPDEPRFAHQAQSMKASGDWIVPAIGGDANVDKPPLLFWSIVIASLPFDRVTETTSRIPSAIGALVVLLLTARLGRRLWGVESIACGGALVALTGIEFFQKAQWCSCDMTMAAFAWAAITLWREPLFDDPKPTRATLRIAWGWAAVGLGILTKGPVAFLWAAFWILAEAIARQRFRPLLRVAWNPGVAIAFLIVSAWIYGLGLRAGWSFVYEATIHQNLDRYANAWNSVQPWWFYAYQIPADLLPWTAFLPAVIAIVFRSLATDGDPRESVAARAVVLFSVFGIVLFSGSSGKRGVYMIEAFPAMSLLVAAAVVRFGRGASGFVLMAGLGLFVGVVAPAAIAFKAIAIPDALQAAAGTLGAIAVVLGGLALTTGAGFGFVLRHRGRREAALASAVSGAIGLFFVLGTVGGAAWSRMQSARPFCDRMDAAAPKGERIAVEDTKFEQFMFYTLRKTTSFRTDAELASILSSDRCRYAIVTRARYERMRRAAPIAGCAVVASSRINRGEYLLIGPHAP